MSRRCAIQFVAIVTMLSLLGGCASQEQAIVDSAVRDYFDGAYAQAAQKLTPLSEKTDENFVINNLRLGSCLLPLYKLDDAEAAFLRAWEVINSTGVNDGGRTLGAVLVDEKIKIWKGEPFERAMASFYLGLIYYIRQDYGNARGAFENALFKLRAIDPETGQKAGDADIDSNFALAMLMLAKSYQHLGREDLARANFDNIRKHYPQLSALADYDLNAQSNLLLVVDYGNGPRKTTNDDGAVVGFAPTPFDDGPIPLPLVRCDGRIIEAGPQLGQPPDDLLAMAQDRKWQSIDTIRAVKSALGTGLIIGGAAAGATGLHMHGGHQRDDLIIAGALIGTGLLLKATSHADIRQWEMLPRTTFVLPLHVEPGTHQIAVEFPGDGNLRQVWQGIAVPENGEATYYMRMQRWNPGPFTWPIPQPAAPATPVQDTKTGM